jgi:transcriptional antiterminator NusG
MLGDKRPKLMGPVDIQKIIKDDKLDLHRENKLVAFMIGEEVTLTDGPFTSFVGTITDIKGDKVTLNVRIFGRFTSVTIDIEHIKKT